MRLRLTLCATVFLAAIGSPAFASTTISTIGDPSANGGGFYCLGADSACGQQFGQTFTISNSDTELTSFSFDLLNQTPSNSLSATFSVYAWNGSAPTGSALYQSAVSTYTGGNQLITFSPDVTLTQGDQYVAVLNGNQAGTGTTVTTFGIGTVAFNSYLGGQFVYQQNVQGSNWISNEQLQTVFSATFVNPTAVPLPASVWLMIGGMGGIGAFMRKRRTA